MSFIEIAIINIILIIFPIFCYFFYSSYFSNINLKVNNIILSLTLFTAFYLDIKFSPILPLIIFNILLLISYLKDKKITSIILSLLFIGYYVYYFHFNIIYLILEYSIYYCLFYFMHRKKVNNLIIINTFVFLKGFVFTFISLYVIKNEVYWLYNFIDIFLNLILFYFITNLSLIVLDKCENIIDLNKTLMELEKEKSLKDSLFKITHEIKNSIAVIKGYMDMIDVHNPKKLEKYLPIIKSEVNRTLTLMDDFLSNTKITINNDIIDIYMLLDEVIKVIKQVINYNDILLEAHIPDEELFVLADYERLKQVLINVLKNAVEAKDINKVMKIIIKTKVINDKILIEVIDNGVGMDSETLKKCGQMFYSTKKNGTGLGVSLSKEIIKLHNGEIKYESVKEKYTKVIICLPINVKIKTA